jgi:N-acetylglutamate synthase-like GNAT family acetyltransferase
MRIRKAKKSDFSNVIHLSQKYDLDYTSMEADDFWVAEEGKKILGIVGLKKHDDCLELCSLGVEEIYRNRGIAKKLVLALLKKAKGNVYLATVIPGFFEKFGFEKANVIPASMIKKSDWCKGCNKELCTVMMRKSE